VAALLDFLLFWIGLLCNLFQVVSVTVLLPALFVHRARSWAGKGLLWAACAFGCMACVVGASMIFTIWGWPGLIFGLLSGGVLLVPLGLVATALNGQWVPCLILFGWFASAYGAFQGAAWAYASHGKIRSGATGR